MASGTSSTCQIACVAVHKRMCEGAICHLALHSETDEKSTGENWSQ